MNKRAKILQWAVVITCALSACATPRQTQFYTLLQAPPPRLQLDSQSIVMIGPVTLPAQVDRPQMVISRDAHELRVLEHQRWAAPLKLEIPRLIGERIEAALGLRVIIYPETTPVPPRFKLNLTVQRFESTPGAQVTVAVTWDIKTVAGNRVESGQRIELEPVVGADYGALASAHARALSRIGDGIANSIAAFD
ncbi:MAG: PqiC family protein, partial [Gammaproteobacteria bacterium]